MMTTLALAVALALLNILVVSPAKVGSRRNPLVVRLQFMHLPGHPRDRHDPIVSGNLRAYFSDGTSRLIDSSGLVDPGDHMPHPMIARDHRTIVWVSGQYGIAQQFGSQYSGNFGHFISMAQASKYRLDNYGQPVYWCGTRLVIYRNGRIIARIKPIDVFIQKWRFTGNGKRVAIRSMMWHGPSIYELHDLSDGRLLGEESGTTPFDQWPAWARLFGP